MRLLIVVIIIAIILGSGILIRAILDNSVERNLPREVSDIPRSEYFGLIKFEPQVTENFSRAQEEYIILQSSQNLETPISLEGWSILRLSDEKLFALPNASQPVVPNTPQLLEPIIIQPKHFVVVTSGSSPWGNSFRTNICSGYATQLFSFSPTIKNRCPLPEDVLVLFGDENLLLETPCVDYLNNQKTCRAPLDHHQTSSLSASCRGFIDKHINEVGCIQDYEEYPNFFLPEWRVYLGETELLWQDGEVLALLDDSGFLVDAVVY
ncbi:MAG: hypothetical protein OXU73_00215 [Candidatus Campbellbacteria bacterium]|nr:hypothetical protein [Candidatus Campbellbacteria bacterium]